MFNFDSQICDVCGQAFKEGDDIVVCPECGTPHHRECWNKLGHCANRDKHARGFEWKGQEILGVNTPAITCPHCGALMPEGTAFCENCGGALTSSDALRPASSQQGQARGGQPSRPAGTPFGMSLEEFNARIAREMNGEIDGVPVADIYAYIGPNAHYFVDKFRRMDRRPGYKPFDLTAMFFSPLWYIFRKMWKFGLLAAVINAFLGFPTFILAAVEMGFLPKSSRLVFPGIANISGIFAMVEFAVGIVWGFLAVPLYRKQVISALKGIKAKCGDNTTAYYREIEKSSGPSKIGAVLVVIFIVYNVMALFL